MRESNYIKFRRSVQAEETAGQRPDLDQERRGQCGEQTGRDLLFGTGEGGGWWWTRSRYLRLYNSEGGIWRSSPQGTEEFGRAGGRPSSNDLSCLP